MSSLQRTFLVPMIGLLLLGAGCFSPGAKNTAPSSSAPELSAAGKQTYHLTEDGTSREFIVYRPNDIPLDEEVPVVFMYHGSGQTGEMFYEDSGWKEKADAEGFVAVFPTALKYHVFADEKVIRGEVQQDVSQYQTKWNGFDLVHALDPAYPDQTLADDVGFSRDMVAFVEDHYAVDSTRIYASGFSNGGGFMNRLAVEATDLFAAFAPSSSGGVTVEGLTEMGYVPPAGFVARPMIRMVGSDDPKLTYATGVDSFSTTEAAMDPGNAVRVYFVDGFLSILGLDDTYTFSQEGRISKFVFATPADGSSSTAEYDLLITDGMKHVYPNGTNFPVNAVDIYWDFFQRFHL